MAKSIMIQGAGSNVGKSLLVAGLCRAFKRRGLTVLPFKPQNMSNNAAVTSDGGEIGRAQALQALACGVAAHTDMNPVLLKPETDVGAQVVVNGKRLTTVKARDYAKLKPDLMSAVLESFERLKKKADLVLVEGAGSPAEINLRAGDIANMGFAEAAYIPVILAGDIDRGGVIAQLVGTWVVLPKEDRDRIKAFLINKFRGDVSLFDDGLDEIKNRTGWDSLGVIPWFADAVKLPAEDAADLKSRRSLGQIKIAVPKLSRIANFDDLDPLSNEPDVDIILSEPGTALPGDADLILIPGSKSTIGDLLFLRDQGWDLDIAAHLRRGGRVLGVCGGYQMLGTKIHDPDGIEGKAGSYDGLGHLDVETTMTAEKTLVEVAGMDETGLPVTGYEIHIGRTDGPDCDRSWLNFDGVSEGAKSSNGLVAGCYIHGLFSSDEFRAAYLKSLGGSASNVSYATSVEDTLDALARHMEDHLDLDAILALAE